MDETTPSKTCTGCGEVKPLTDYSRNSKAPDGLAWRCLACRGAAWRTYRSTPAGAEVARRASRAYASRNPEKVAAAQRRWREEHPDYSAISNARWREEHPEAAAAYYRLHRERILAQTRARVAANPEAKAARNKAWAAANPERRSAAARRWQKAHPEKAREIAHRRRTRLRAATVGPVDLDLLWTGLCGLCLEDLNEQLVYPDPMSKSIDHIVPLALGGTHEQANLQWAHLVCNNRKGSSDPFV